MHDEFRDHSTKKLIIFLRKQIYEFPPEYGPCLKVVCRHLKSDGGMTHDIQTYVVPRYTGAQDPPPLDEIERGAAELVNAAMEDANGMNRGVQRYAFLAFHDRSGGEWHGRCLLRFTGGKETFGSQDAAEYGVGDMSDSEGPDPRGLVAQAQRHVEAIMKQSVAVTGATMRTLVEQNTFLNNNVRAMMEKQLQTYAIMESMMSQRHERELAVKKQEVMLRGFEDIADKLKILLPHMVNKAVGRKLLPTRSSPGEQELASLVETIRPEQVDNLKKIFTPDQMLALLSVMERVVKEAEEVKKDDPSDGAMTVIPGGKADKPK